MQVILSERVKTALATLSRDDRDRVNTWFGYLANWEQDPFVKAQSVRLDMTGQTVYLFRTSTDVRIFYTVDEQKHALFVLDVTTKDTILNSGTISTGGS